MYRVMRILNRFNIGGPVYNASYLSADLAPEFETRLYGGALAPGEASAAYIPRSLGVDPIEVPHMARNIRLNADRRAYLWLRQEMRRFRPHIVHTHASKAGAVGRLAAFHERVPVVVHTFHGHVFHSYFGRMTSSVYQRIERYLASRSTAIVAISEAQKHELCELYRITPQEKTHVIPLGFDLNRFTIDHASRRRQFRELLGWPDSDFVVGMIGRLVAVKHHELLLKAAAKLKQEQRHPARWVIVGDGELREHLDMLAQSLGLTTAKMTYPLLHPSTADVVFTSWVKEVEDVLPGFDTVVLTSHNEGTPVSIIEAQAAGIPVVSTRVGGVNDVIAHGQTGFIVEPGDVNAFTNAVVQLRDNSALRQRFALAAPEHVMQRYGRERLAAEMRELYMKLL